VRIVAAALQHKDGRTVVGVRHYDELMIGVLSQLPDFMSVGWRTADQGFVDNHGRYLTREAAWHVAEAAGQIVVSHLTRRGVLHSEDLW
jgi:hypothetical protein